jgi:ferredoxin
MTRNVFLRLLGLSWLAQDTHPEKYKKRRADDPCVKSKTAAVLGEDGKIVQVPIFSGEVVPCAEGEEYCPSCGISQKPMIFQLGTPNYTEFLDVNACDNCGVLYVKPKAKADPGSEK